MKPLGYVRLHDAPDCHQPGKWMGSGGVLAEPPTDTWGRCFTVCALIPLADLGQDVAAAVERADRALMALQRCRGRDPASTARHPVTDDTGAVTARDRLIKAVGPGGPMITASRIIPSGTGALPWVERVRFEATVEQAAALADEIERGRAALDKIRTPEQIAEQRAKGWPDFHPEDYCHRCGHPNVRSWSVDSEVWNAVFRTTNDGDWSDQWQGIICPPCFASFAAEYGIHEGSWELRIDGSTTPKGRAEVERLTAERDAALAKIADLKADLEAVAQEHEDCPTYCDDCLRWELPRSCIWCKGSGCAAETALGAYSPCDYCGGDGRRHDHDEWLPRLIDALADCVIKATEYGEQEDGFVLHYMSPTGPIHRAIPLLQELGVTVRPGFDGRRALDGTSGGDRKSKRDATLQDLARLIESLHDDCKSVARPGIDPAVNRQALALIEPVLATLAGHVRRLAGPEDGTDA